MKLWIDDFRTPPDASWTWAITLAEAITYYRMHVAKEIELSEISFDHDLGVLIDFDHPLDEAQTTMPLAKLIEEDAFDGIRPPKWSVHSMNPIGRANLEATLRSADRLYNECRPEKTAT